MSLARSQSQAVVTTENCTGHPLSGQLSAVLLRSSCLEASGSGSSQQSFQPKSGTQKTSNLASDPEVSRTKGLKLQLEGLE